MRKVKLGNLEFGSEKIYIQSMCNIKTSKINEVVKQINELENIGLDIIRVSVLDIDDAKAIKEIKKHINIPIVADIHFDHLLALESIDSGVDKIRLNPANIKDESKIKEIVLKCIEKNIPIRIGINAGSFLLRDNKVNQMIEYAKKNIKILEDLNFYNIVLSFKSSSLEESLEVNRIASKLFDYPLHIGLTEAGTLINGTVKNTMLISTLLQEGIGSTIRVSLTSEPINEVKVAKEILKLNKKYSGPNLISCPTCGRTKVDLISIASSVEKYLDSVKKSIEVAVMGCVVNGPGEAKDADIGVALSGDLGVIFKKGEILKKVKYGDILDELFNEIDKL